MADEVKKRISAGGLLLSYGLALYQSGSDMEKIDRVNDPFDAAAAMVLNAGAASGSSSAVAVVGIDLTPYTVVDKEYFNIEADLESNRIGGIVWAWPLDREKKEEA